MVHQTRPNAACQGPSRIVFFDCETSEQPVPGRPKEKLLTFRLAQACRLRLSKGRVTRERWRLFSTPTELWEWIFDFAGKAGLTHVFAHNCGFDATVSQLWGLLDEGRVTLDYAITRDPPTIIGMSRGAAKIILIDTLNWFRCPLWQLGESMGLPKLTMPALSAPDEDWAVYCHRDVTIIRDAMIGVMAWTRENDLGNWRMTAAGQAYAAWRHRFGGRFEVAFDSRAGPGAPEEKTEERVYPVLHGDTLVRDLERRAYFGGRAECWYLGDVAPAGEAFVAGEAAGAKNALPTISGPVYHLDVNSLYPSVMLDQSYPAQLLETISRPSLDRLRELLVLCCVIAEVRLSTGADQYPLSTDNITIYPVGTYSTVLCGPELEWALDRGQIVEVGLCALYRPLPLFMSFVSELWALRSSYSKKGNEMYAGLCKTLLNALPGKFGQRNPDWVEVRDYQPPVRWGSYNAVNWETGECHVMRAIAGMAQVEGDGLDALHAYPAIPAYVCSAGRVKMRQLMALLPPRSLLYSDTDSLHVLEAGAAALSGGNMVDQNCLGKLKLVEVLDSAGYRGLRHWNAGRRVIAAGLPRSAHRTGPGKYACELWQRVNEIIGRQPLPGVIVTIREYTEPLSYRHGVVGHDGWVSPHNVQFGGLCNARAEE